MSKTEYIVVDSAVSGGFAAEKVAELLDDGYTLLISWVAGTYVHHILTKDDSEL